MIILVSRTKAIILFCHIICDLILKNPLSAHIPGFWEIQIGNF